MIGGIMCKVGGMWRFQRTLAQSQLMSISAVYHPPHNPTDDTNSWRQKRDTTYSWRTHIYLHEFNPLYEFKPCARCTVNRTSPDHYDVMNSWCHAYRTPVVFTSRENGRATSQHSSKINYRPAMILMHGAPRPSDEYIIVMSSVEYTNFLIEY